MSRNYHQRAINFRSATISQALLASKRSRSFSEMRGIRECASIDFEKERTRVRRRPPCQAGERPKPKADASAASCRGLGGLGGVADQGGVSAELAVALGLVVPPGFDEVFPNGMG